MIMQLGPIVSELSPNAYGSVSALYDLFGTDASSPNTPLHILPDKYQDFADVFEKKAAETLPERY